MGKSVNAFCRVFVNTAHASAHVLQTCTRSHGASIRRRNPLSTYLRRQLEIKGHKVYWEPVFRTSDGRRKPDIVVDMGDDAYNLYPAICSNNVETSTVCRNKVSKYEHPEYKVIVSYMVHTQPKILHVSP